MTEELVTIEGGEYRIGTMSTARTFFFYVTPTGTEMGMSQAPRESIKPFARATKKNTYKLMQPLMLKMFTSVTEFGRPKSYRNVYIHLDPDGPVLTVMGLQGYGSIKCRGTVAKEKSNLDGIVIKVEGPAIVKPSVLKSRHRRILV